MSSRLPIPKDLRPQLNRPLEDLDEAGLLLVHEVFLHIEKEQLWHQISDESSRTGKAV